MKRSIAFLIISFLSINFSIGQNSHLLRKNTKNYSELIKQNINSINTISSVLDEKVVLCEEYWESNYETGELELEEESEISIEKLDANKYIYIITTDIYDDELGIYTRYAKLYFRKKPGFYNEIVLDSINVYIVLENIQIPYLVTKNIFDGDKITKSTSYYNWDFDFPPKFELEDSTLYYYDNNNFLINKVSYSIYSSVVGVAIVDSSIYTNNQFGLPVQSLEYKYDYDKDAFGLKNKVLYQYNSDNELVSEKTFSNPESWELTEKQTINYNTGNKVKLYQKSNDNGTTWINSYRDSIYYMPVLDFEHPKREVFEVFSEGKWNVSELYTHRVCDSTAKVSDFEKISFNAYFSFNTIKIDMEDEIKDVNVKLVNMEGKILFNKKYKSLPNSIFINNLTSGIYILQLVSNNKTGVIKLMKN